MTPVPPSKSRACRALFPLSKTITKPPPCPTWFSHLPKEHPSPSTSQAEQLAVAPVSVSTTSTSSVPVALPSISTLLPSLSSPSSSSSSSYPSPALPQPSSTEWAPLHVDVSFDPFSWRWESDPSAFVLPSYGPAPVPSVFFTPPDIELSVKVSSAQ